MCDNTNTTTQSIADYLSQLLKDRKQLAAFPNVFIHVERLLDEGESVISRFLFFFSSYLLHLSLSIRFSSFLLIADRGIFACGVTRPHSVVGRRRISRIRGCCVRNLSRW